MLCDNILMLGVTKHYKGGRGEKTNWELAYPGVLENGKLGIFSTQCFSNLVCFYVPILMDFPML